MSVPAKRMCTATVRPIQPAAGWRTLRSRPGARQFQLPADVPIARTAQQEQDDLLDIEDVVGKRMISTRLKRNVTIGEEHATAALEVLTRFAADPRWLMYLPPTMSPTETS